MGDVARRGDSRDGGGGGGGGGGGKARQRGSSGSYARYKVTESLETFVHCCPWCSIFPFADMTDYLVFPICH